MSSTQELRYWLDVDGKRYPLRQVCGHETMSRDFRFELGFTLQPDASLDPDDLVKREAALILERDSEVRRVKGVISDVRVGASVSGQPNIEIVLEPWFAMARHRQDIRIYRDKTVPQIVADVLDRFSVSHALRLSETYPVRPYTVQFRETDHHFVNRLLEEEGFFFFFDGEGTMVIGDHTAAYDSIGGVTAIPLRAGSGLDEHDDAVFDIGSRAALTVGKVTLRDWNAETPSLDMDVSEKGPSDSGPEWYDYPGEYEEPSRGQTLARLMSESYACAAAKNQGTTSCGRFAPGRTFDLTSTQTAGPRGGLVILSVSHDWKVDETGFSSPFVALASDVTYRAPREHEEPVLTNPMTGIVTGPAGEDIHTDEYGRVKVQFHWDREFPEDDTCSHWIPVMQDNTGHSVGIPRTGWEVLVHFLEGDPDRPVVMGRVYNGADTIPRPLPRDKTWSSLRSLSSPGRDGNNTIEFRDPTNDEQISIHAERDQVVNVVNNKDQKVLINENVQVAHDETVQIGADHTAKITGAVVFKIQNNQSWTVGGNSDRKVTGADQDSVSKDRSLTIGGHCERTVATDDSITVQGDFFELVGGSVVETSVEGNMVEAGQDLFLTVGGSVVETAKGDKQESVGKQRIETVAGDVSWIAGGAIQVQASDKRITALQGSLNVHAVDDIALTGAEKCTVLSNTATHQGSRSITMKVGDTVVVMQEGMIKIVASDKITMKTTAQNNQGAGKSTQI